MADQAEPSITVAEATDAELTTALRQLMQTTDLRAFDDWSRYVKASGLSIPQFGVLMRLYYRGPCPISAVGDHMDITNAAASQLVDRLVQQGLIERREDQRDRRVRTLSLSTVGRRLVESGIAERYRWIEEVIPRLSEEQRAAIAAALPALIETARADSKRRGAHKE